MCMGSGGVTKAFCVKDESKGQTAAVMRLDVGPSELTERFEDVIAGLISVFCVGLIIRVLSHSLLSVLVTSFTTMPSPSSVAFGHLYSNVNGMMS